MKNKDLYILRDGIEAVLKLHGAKFAYGLAKNKKIVDNEISTIKDTLDKNIGFRKYLKERDELIKSMGEANGTGYKIIKEKVDLFNKELDKIVEKYKKEIDEYGKEEKELLDIENNVDLYKIKLSDVPATITGEQMDGIAMFIEDD